MEECVVGVDIGTSACKVLAISRDLEILSEKSGKYPTYVPKPGWTEQNPEDWWAVVGSLLADISKELREKGYEIAGIGLTGQMHGLVVLDDKGNVLRPCIMWNDQRNYKQCLYAIEKLGGLENVIKLINNGIMPGFTIGKILWVMENEQEIFAKASKLLNPKDYIRFKLTGNYITDVSDASGTHMFDVKNRRWCDEILETFNIPEYMLPDKVVESSEITGYVSDNVSKDVGLIGEVAVVGGGGDAVVQLAASGSTDPTKLCILIGTAGVVGLTVDKYFENSGGILQFYCNVIPGRWIVFGCTLAAGGSLEWFRQVFADSEEAVAKWCNKSVFDILSEEAEKAPIGSGGVFFLPYLTGERAPHTDPNARGVFIGLNLMTRKPEVVRSVLEGVAYSLRSVGDILRMKSGSDIREVYLSGGGAASNVWRQIFADVFGVRVKTLKYSEKGGSLGAAILAGVGIKFWKKLEDAVESLEVVYENEHHPENHEKYEKLFRIYERLYPILKPAFHLISEEDHQ
ncbi:MAG: xylulokinase [Candidatus Bathyarchaeia archaeon]